jgi:hypothetical protein
VTQREAGWAGPFVYREKVASTTVMSQRSLQQGNPGRRICVRNMIMADEHIEVC